VRQLVAHAERDQPGETGKVQSVAKPKQRVDRRGDQYAVPMIFKKSVAEYRPGLLSLRNEQNALGVVGVSVAIQVGPGPIAAEENSSDSFCMCGVGGVTLRRVGAQASLNHAIRPLGGPNPKSHADTAAAERPQLLAKAGALFSVECSVGEHAGGRVA